MQLEVLLTQLAMVINIQLLPTRRRKIIITASFPVCRHLRSERSNKRQVERKQMFVFVCVFCGFQNYFRFFLVPKEVYHFFSFKHIWIWVHSSLSFGKIFKSSTHSCLHLFFKNDCKGKSMCNQKAYVGSANICLLVYILGK